MGSLNLKQKFGYLETLSIALLPESITDSSSIANLGEEKLFPLVISTGVCIFIKKVGKMSRRPGTDRADISWRLKMELKSSGIAYRNRYTSGRKG